MRKEFFGHDGAGVEADRAVRDEVAPAHGDEIGGAGPGADEMHNHGPSSVLASAHVTGPTTMRGRMSRALGPAAASAAASATEGTPASASTRLDHVAPRAPAISSSA